ncbi:MAG: RNA methyltransferase [Ruminococcaceae bacterium]|nr:RNA methyltransferase [Oscillospiraceae bacterium]
MQKEDIKFQDSNVFEGMTSIRAVIKSIDSGNSDRKILKVIFDCNKVKKIAKEIGYFKAVSSKYGFELIESNSDYIETLTLGSSSGGIIAVTTDRAIPKISEQKICDNGFYVLLQGIEDPYNFGYSLRSLYACGADGIILPERNWMSAAGVVCRSSAGASELISMYTAPDVTDAINMFKSRGYTIVCADEKTDNVLGECPLPLPVLLIIGGEKRGISRSVLDLADTLVKIDYKRDFHASLSAASATTMFAYEIMRQNKSK